MKRYILWSVTRKYNEESPYSRLSEAVEAAKKLLKEHAGLSLVQVWQAPERGYCASVDQEGTVVFSRLVEVCEDHDDCYENEKLGRACYWKSRS